jgi:hypothetical protein
VFRRSTPLDFVGVLIIFSESSIDQGFEEEPIPASKSIPFFFKVLRRGNGVGGLGAGIFGDDAMHVAGFFFVPSSGRRRGVTGSARLHPENFDRVS